MYNRNINIEDIKDNDIQALSKSSITFIIDKLNLEAYKRSIVYSGASKWDALKMKMKILDFMKCSKIIKKGKC